MKREEIYNAAIFGIDEASFAEVGSPWEAAKGENLQAGSTAMFVWRVPRRRSTVPGPWGSHGA